MISKKLRLHSLVAASLLLTSCEEAWTSVRISENCAVSFPGEPVSSEKQETSRYGTYVKHVYSLLTPPRSNENEGYVCYWTEMPAAYTLTVPDQEKFSELISQEADLLGGRVVSTEPLRVGGNLACDARIDFRGGEYRVTTRYVVYGRFLYAAFVITEKNKIFNPAVKRFLNSLTPH